MSSRGIFLRVFRLVALICALVLIGQLQTVTPASARQRAAQRRTPDAPNGPRAKVRPLPLSAVPNHGLPRGERPPVDPPSTAAHGKPKRLTARAWRAVPRPAEGAAFGPSAGQVQGPTARGTGTVTASALSTVDGTAQTMDGGEGADGGEVVAADRLVLRPGFTMGDTSLALYFDLQDKGFTSWTASVFDAETGAEQASATLGVEDLAACGSPRQYCRSFGTAEGWVLDPDRSYFARITVTYEDGATVVSPPSNESKPRKVLLPPAIPAAQTSGCACADVLGRSAPGQQVRGFGVNTGTGVFSRTESDLSLASFGVPFAANRWYSSASTTPGMLGVGWTWSYDVLVTATDDGAVVRAEDGAQAVYQRRDDGSYRRPAGVRSKLTKTDAGWKLTTPEHTTLRFDSEGRLLSVVDVHDNGVNLGYDAGGLSSITDAAGRVVKITLRTDLGLIRRIDLPDRRFVQFDYDGRRMITAQAPNGRTTQYRYDSSGRLSQVIDPRGQVQVTNTYDASSGRVLKQTDVFGKSTTFAWDADKEEAKTTDADGVVHYDGYKNNHLVYTQNGNGDTHHVRYDTEGNPDLDVDGNGNQRETVYDADGNPTDQKAPEPFGFTEKASYESGNEPTSFTDGNGHTWKAEYNDFHELVKKTDAEGHSWTYEYDDRGLKTSEKDPRGHVTRFEYDADGNQTAKVTPTGRRYEFGYDGSGRLISTTDPRGTASGADPSAYTTRYAYDEGDRPTSTTEPGKRPAVKTYDELGRIAVDTDPEGNSVRYTYDVANRLVEIKDKIGNITSASYTAAGRKASITDPEGGRTTYAYNKKGLLEKVVSPLGNRDGADPAPFTTTLSYDQNDNPLRATTPAPGGGTVTKDLRYDELDRTTADVDENGVATEGSYDNADNLSKVGLPGGGTLSFGYDANNRPTSEEGPNGNVAKVDYDAAGNVIKQVTAMGGVTTQTYDDDDRLVSAVEPRGNIDGADPDDFRTRFGYDAAGNRTSVTDPLGNVTRDVFDANSRLTAHTDANGHTTRYRYDQLDRVTEIIAADSTDGRATTFKYNAMDDLVERRDPNGNAISASYDRLGRVSSSNDSLGRLRQYVYDAESRLTQIVTAGNSGGEPAGRTIFQTFDNLGRLTKRQLGSGGLTYTFGYDDKNRLVSTGDPGGLTTRTYDDADRLTKVTREGRVYEYDYDHNGNLVSRVNPDGTAMTARYDDDDQITSLSQAGGRWTFDYDAAGHRTKTELPGSSVEERTFDRAGRLTHLDTHGEDGTLGRYDLTLEPVGNPSRIRTTRGSVSEDVAYTFDPVNRLSAACYGTTSCDQDGTGKITYTYDQVGNRTSSARTGSAGSDSTTYRYDTTNQLVSRTVTGTGAGTTTYTYDSEGNQTRAGADTFVYNLDHTLASATIDQKQVVFGYDGLGNRLTETTGSGSDARTITADWDFGSDLPQITSERVEGVSGSALRSFVTGPDGETLGLLDADTELRSLYVHDWLGGTSGLVSPSGAVQALYDYDPYGQPRSSPTQAGLDPAGNALTDANPLRFAGGYADEQLGGSYFLRARNYDPSTGRFLSRDPAPRVGVSASSAYAYADGVPTSFTDPTGQWSIGGALSSIGNGISNAASATVSFVDKHQADIVGFAAGVAVGVGCTVATGGAGVVACAAAGGAAGAAASYAWKTKVQGEGEFSWGDLAKETAIGALTGAALGAAGKYVTKIPGVSNLLNKAGGLLKSGLSRLGSGLRTAAARLGSGVRAVASSARALGSRAAGLARTASAQVRAALTRGAPRQGVTINLSTAGRTADEAAAIREYAARTNTWLRQNGSQVIQSTDGALRAEASAAARAERLRAARAGVPYRGQAGHVPDTAITGLAQPPGGWLDMPGYSNQVAGGVLASRIGQLLKEFSVDGVVL